MLPRPALALLAVCAAGCLKIPPDSTVPEEHAPKNMVAWPGKSAAQLYAPGEVRAFTLLQSRKAIGTSWGRYDGPVAGEPGHHRFSTRIELTPPRPDGRPADPLRSAGEVVVDERGALVRGFERSPAAELRFERKGEALLFEAGRERDEITYRDGDAFMAFSAIFHEELMFGLRPLTEGELAWRLVSLSGSMPTEWSAKLSLPDPATPGVARIQTSLGETIDLRDGRIERVEIAADDIEVLALARPPAWPAWEVAGPPVLAYSPPAGASFAIREVDLPGRPGDPALAGEVLVPTGKAPHPAVLFLSSTGQQDRHGLAGPPPVDLGSHEITDALAAAGFVVLRFDERGYGRSAAGPVSFQGQLEDARRALRTLLVQDEVDPDRVTLVGHGEGGWKALTLAGEDPKIRAVALLAAPGRPYEQILQDQAAAALRAVPPALRPEAQKSQERTLLALKTGRDVPPELAPQALWIREVLQLSPDALVSGGQAPLWIAQGDRDFEVDPLRDPAELVALARRHRRRADLRVFHDLDHLFKPETEDSRPSRYLEPGRPVDPEFLRELSTWLSSQVKGPAAKPGSPGAPRRAR